MWEEYDSTDSWWTRHKDFFGVVTWFFFMTLVIGWGLSM